MYLSITNFFKNKKKLRTLVFFLLSFVLVCLLIYRFLPPSSDPNSFFSKSITSKNSDEQFDAFTDTLFRQEISGDAISLHFTLKNPEAYGILDAPVTLGSFPCDPDESAAYFENTLAALNRFSKKDLSKEHQLTYDILKDSLQTNLSCCKYLLYEEPLSPLTGIQSQLPVLLSEYSFYSVTDIDTYLALLSTMQDYFHSLLVFEQEKAKHGLFMSDSCVDHVIRECQDFLSLENDNYLYTSFEERLNELGTLTKSEYALYISKNKDLLKTQVFPAYQSLADGLLALKGSGKTDRGLCTLPDGKKCYEAFLKQETGSDRSVNELAQLAASQIIEDMKALKQVIPVSGINEEVILQESSPESILSDLKCKMEDSFPKIPAVTCSVKQVPKSMQDYLSPAFYLIPPIDDTTQNTIYINPKNTISGLNLFTTLAHEGYPGHLYQTTYFLSQNPSPIRTILDFGGYTEGWATYTEMMSYYLAPVSKEAAVAGQKNASIMLGLYSLADIGIHYKGWSFDDTVSFFAQYGIKDENSIQEIYRLIVSDPGNYPKYYFGYVELLELKKEAMALWKDDFSQKRFHKFILDMGPAPFSVIRDKLVQ
nr:DUF885 domain-containing protein [uncultured Sellimonas sp.]